MRITRPVFFIILILQSFAAYAVDDLLSIYEQALQNDPQYRAAEAEYRARQEATSQGWAPLLPQINLRGNIGSNSTELLSYPANPAIDGSTLDYDTKDYILSLSQTIFNNEYYAQLRQANAQVAQAEANFNNARLELMVRVAERYFTYLGAIDNLTFARAEKKAIAQQLNQTRQRYNVGLTAITDVHEAKARYDLSVAQNISAENLLAVAREDLREITGVPYDKIAALRSDSPLVRPNPDDINAWVKIGSEHSLALIAAQKNRDVAEEQVSRVRSGHYPTLNLKADYAYNDADGGIFGQRETQDTAIALELNVPIYSGGLVSSQTREASALFMQAKEQYEQVRRSTERDIRSAYLSVLSNRSSVEAYAQALESSRTALQATEAGFEVGTRTAVDVLDSQRELYRAERDYARSRYDYILQFFRLKQAAGTLSHQDIKTVNTWLK